MRGWVNCSAIALTIIVGWFNASAATTSYYIRLRPTGVTGLRSTIAFDLIHTDDPDSNLNRATLLTLAHDGKADSAQVEGGPGYGDLMSATNPAGETTLEGQYFYNSLAVPIDSLGTFVTLRLNLTERTQRPSLAPDEFSMYFVSRSTGIPFPTADDLGTNALFAIDITGPEGGALTVFSPMTFIPPDTLALDGTVLAVPPENGPVGRLQFRAVMPNPSLGGVRLVYEVPEPGGELRIRVFDFAGRLVAKPFVGKRAAGVWTTPWDARDTRGHGVAAGVYIIQLQMGGQSLVRRVVLTR